MDANETNLPPMNPAAAAMEEPMEQETHTPFRVDFVVGAINRYGDNSDQVTGSLVEVGSHGTYYLAEICRHVVTRPFGNDESPANGRRLAAAWNAAHDANLTTAALEAGIVKEAMGLLRQIAAEQLDELFRVSFKTERRLAIFMDKMNAAIQTTAPAGRKPGHPTDRA